MSINAPSSTSSTTAASSSASVSNQQVSSSSDKKTSSESSFKKEMETVSAKNTDKSASEAKKSDNSVQSKDNSTKDKQDLDNNNTTNLNNNLMYGDVNLNNFQQMSMMEMNSMLTSDIQQVMAVNSTEIGRDTFSGLTLDFTNKISMDSSDADFFIALTNQDNVTPQNIVAQAQNLLNNGADIKEVAKNVKISETLLNAIAQAKENNQPLRIDFGKDIAVILRINSEGVLSANFIPGDKAVEQYLRNNISNLKQSFESQDLPYSELSYSNRGSKQQKENRRNNNEK